MDALGERVEGSPGINSTAGFLGGTRGGGGGGTTPDRET